MASLKALELQLNMLQLFLTFCVLLHGCCSGILISAGGISGNHYGDGVDGMLNDTLIKISSAKTTLPPHPHPAATTALLNHIKATLSPENQENRLTVVVSLNSTSPSDISGSNGKDKNNLTTAHPDVSVGNDKLIKDSNLDSVAGSGRKTLTTENSSVNIGKSPKKNAGNHHDRAAARNGRHAQSTDHKHQQHYEYENDYDDDQDQDGHSQEKSSGNISTSNLSGTVGKNDTLAKCKDGTLRNCINQIPPLPDIGIPSTVQGVQNACSAYNKGMDCVHNWTKDCFTEKQAQRLNSSILGAHEIYTILCNDESFRSAYLQHGHCYNKISKHWDACAVGFITALKHLKKHPNDICWTQDDGDGS